LIPQDAKQLPKIVITCTVIVIITVVVGVVTLRYAWKCSLHTVTRPIVISKLLKRHSKVKRMAPDASNHKGCPQRVVQRRFRSGCQRVRVNCRPCRLPIATLLGLGTKNSGMRTRSYAVDSHESLKQIKEVITSLKTIHTSAY